MNLRLAAAAATLLTACLVAGCQGDDQNTLAVVVTLPEQGVTGAAKATMLLDYSGTGAKIVSEGSSPACAFILPGIDGEFTDDHRGNLTIHASGPRSLRGPADIVACRMKAGSADVTAAAIQAKLALRVTAAEDAAGKPIDLAAKSAKPHGEQRSELEIEAAQQEAVKAAASTVPPPAPAVTGAAGGEKGTETASGSAPGTAPARTGTGSAVGVGPGTVAASSAAPASVAGKAAATKPPAPSAPAPGTILRNPTAMAGGGSQGSGSGNGNGGVPNPTDKDPSYDGSQGQNPSVAAYNLDVNVTSASRFGALQLEITHLGSSGGFMGLNDAIDCTPLVQAIVAGNNPGERTAKLGLISLGGVLTPATILRCGFRSRESLSPASFLVQVTDAADTNSEAIEPPPTVVISNVSRR